VLICLSFDWLMGLELIADWLISYEVTVGSRKCQEGLVCLRIESCGTESWVEEEDWEARLSPE